MDERAVVEEVGGCGERCPVYGDAGATEGGEGCYCAVELIQVW